jgi:hypothetical protein
VKEHTVDSIVENLKAVLTPKEVEQAEWIARNYKISQVKLAYRLLPRCKRCPRLLSDQDDLQIGCCHNCIYIARMKPIEVEWPGEPVNAEEHEDA